jgi:hypothetical protein
MVAASSQTSISAELTTILSLHGTAVPWPRASTAFSTMPAIKPNAIKQDE